MKLRDAVVVAALAALLSSTSVRVFGAPLTTIGPTDLIDIRHVSNPRVSPDGKSVAYVVTTPTSPGQHANAHIWLVPADGSSPARPFVDGGHATDTDPRWSPDGNMLAFLSDRDNRLFGQESGVPHFSLDPATAVTRPDAVNAGDPDANSNPGMQLWIIPLGGGEASPLTAIPGGIRDPHWSPDGKSVYFLRTDQDTVAERAAKKLKQDQTLVNENYKFSRLWVYTFADHRARLVNSTNFNVDAYDISPDGAAIVARVSPTPLINDFWYIARIVLIDGASGAVTHVVEEHASFVLPKFSPDGKSIVFSQRVPEGISQQAVIYDLATAKTTLVGTGFLGSIEQLIWSPDGKNLYVQVVKGAHTEILRGESSGANLTRIEAVSGSEGEITVSKDCSILVYLGASMQSPNEVWSLSKTGPRQLTESNPQIKNWNIGTEREISWKSATDGTLIYGVLVLPPNYEAGHRYKLAVHIHGGPEEAWTTGWHGTWYDYAALLSSHGYVVLLPNPRGSLGQGSHFLQANRRDWGGGDFRDIQDGVDFLIAQGVADQNRMVIGGWSFGGFMTAWTVTHNNRFKAAVVGAGVTDLLSMATTSDVEPSFLPDYFGDPGSNMKLYDERSSVRYIDQCHTPVLVLHGEADTRVPISQGEEFYYGLHFVKREAAFVRYPREPHIFVEREHQIDSLQRILDWYEIHLTQSTQ